MILCKSYDENDDYIIFSVATAAHIPVSHLMHKTCSHKDTRTYVHAADADIQYIVYAIQGSSHSPTLISNTDNEETAAVTMETSEDTEACKVVLVTQWMREFKLNVIL